MKKIILFLFLLSSFYSFSQQVKFRKVIGSSGYDYGMSAKQTSDHGYIIGGSTSSFGAGATDMYIVKTDSMGIPVNDQTYGGINIDQGNCIRQTTDHGYIIAGYTNSFGAGGYDMYLVKTDSNLAMQWSKTYGGADWDFANCVEQTADGGYILCGGTYSFGKGNEDYYLVKTNSLGDTLWTKTYGDTLEDIANSVIQTTDGGYLITGTTKSLGDTLGDMYTIKTDMIGSAIWTNKFGGFSNCPDKGNDIIESRYGGYILCGETQVFGIGNTNGVAVKIDANGITHADSLYQTYAPEFDNLVSVTEDINGRIAMVGRIVVSGDPYGNGDVFLTQINRNWSFYYATGFGSDKYEIGNSVEPTADGGFIICGYTESFNNNLPDIYLIKTNQASDSACFTTMHDSFFTTNVETNTFSANTLFNIYPNPAKSTIDLFIESKTHPIMIKIINIIGQEVKQIKINKNTSTDIVLHVEDLEDGIYFITLFTEENAITKKLIIQN